MPKQMITDRGELEQLLAQARSGCLATVGADGQPYITPLNHLYCDGCIYFHCALTGRKLTNIAHNPRVCFAVYDQHKLILGQKAGDCSTRYASVLCFGTARIVADGPRKQELLTALSAHYMGYEPEPATESCCQRCALVEIRITELTGKRNVD